MSKEKELDVVTIISNPERERICRKAQRNKNKKVKHILTPKDVLFALSGGVGVFMLMYWAGLFIM